MKYYVDILDTGDHVGPFITRRDAFQWTLTFLNKGVPFRIRKA